MANKNLFIGSEGRANNCSLAQNHIITLKNNKLLRQPEAYDMCPPTTIVYGLLFLVSETSIALEIPFLRFYAVTLQFAYFKWLSRFSFGDRIKTCSGFSYILGVAEYRVVTPMTEHINLSSPFTRAEQFISIYGPLLHGSDSVLYPTTSEIPSNLYR